MALVESLKARAKDVREREAAVNKQALERIPKEYHGFIVKIEQNQKLGPALRGDRPDEETKVKIDPEAFIKSGDGGGTYLPVKMPYMSVDGRVAWAKTDVKTSKGEISVRFETQWVREAREILAAVTARGPLDAAAVAEILKAIPAELKNILTCVVSISGEGGSVTCSAEGSAKIGWSGVGVDRTNPYENSQTSALGRALGFLGYGLIGTGIASSDEVSQALAEQAKLDAVLPTQDTRGIPAPLTQAVQPQPIVTQAVQTPPPAPKPVTTTPPTLQETVPEPSSDPAFVQEGGPCADCGGPLTQPMVNAVVKRRKVGSATRWAHSSVPGLTCESPNVLKLREAAAVEKKAGE